MTDRLRIGPEDLPPDLGELDAELSGIRYEERPSFAPELEAELAREWSALQGRRYWPVRQLLAAGVAGLLLVGVGVPSARAALVRFVGALAGEGPGRTEPPRAAAPSVSIPSPSGVGAEISPGLRPPAVPLPGSAGSERFSLAEATFPELLDRAGAEALIRRSYPMSLQRAGVGGVVGVLLWVDSTGTVEFVNLGRSSGVPDLDRAALQVAPALRFEPARRQGKAVGTWVQFDVRFEPLAESER